MIDEFEVQRLKDLDNRLGLSHTLFSFAELFAHSGRFQSAGNAQDVLDEAMLPWHLKSIAEDQVEIHRVEMLSPIANNKIRFKYSFTHKESEYVLELFGSTRLRVKQDEKAVLLSECVGGENIISLLGFDARGKWYETLLSNINTFYEELAVLKFHYNKRSAQV